MSRKDEVFKYFDDNREYVDLRVKSGIELNRKGSAKLVIKDKDGNVLKGAKVKAVQKNHEFRHGANIFMLDEFENEEKNKMYREKFKDAFNLATLPFYWNTLEPEKGKPRFSVDSPKVYRRPAIDLCMEYCNEHNIEPKAHCLNYDHIFVPDWVNTSVVSEHKAALEKRFRELAQRYADKIPSWEVTNETFYTKGMNQSNFYYEEDFLSWSYRMADRYFPLNRLIINDNKMWGEHFLKDRSLYYMQIERLLEKDKISHLDSIGLQFHVFVKRENEKDVIRHMYNPIHIFDLLDTYEKLGKKIQITELTLSALSADAEDEEVQARLLKELYSVFFSHPAMEAIIYWNLVDGYAFVHDSDAKKVKTIQGDMTVGENQYYGGLLRFDMSEKPSYKVLKDLFTKEWHTEIEKDSDDCGKVEFRGFYGDYDLEVEYDGKLCKREFKLCRDMKAVDITI